jgi:predicted MFS family arabinose efflux permease
LTIVILAFGPAIGLGMGRFAYSLVLPDMRETLNWSYATAGTMNTINAIGYLAGAFFAAYLARKVGLRTAIRIGVALCIVSLGLGALSGHLVPFGIARLATGVGGAIALVCGGALATSIAQANPSRSALLIGLFYTGPALGIVISGLTAPFLLHGFGPGSWWIVWAALAAISVVLAVPFFMVGTESEPAQSTASTAHVPLMPIALYLASYFLYGAGYIAYMTFMIAYIRDHGGGPTAQSAFWCLIGLGGILAPWIYRPLMARGQNGTALAVTTGCTGIGAGLALISPTPALLAISAFVFGSAFLATVTAVTAFTRFNYHPETWPKLLGILTITFSLGQILGPVVTGIITDITGNLYAALMVSAAALILAAICAVFQRPLGA